MKNIQTIIITLVIPFLLLACDNYSTSGNESKLVKEHWQSTRTVFPAKYACFQGSDFLNEMSCEFKGQHDVKEYYLTDRNRVITTVISYKNNLLQVNEDEFRLKWKRYEIINGAKANPIILPETKHSFLYTPCQYVDKNNWDCINAGYKMRNGELMRYGEKFEKGGTVIEQVK